MRLWLVSHLQVLSEGRVLSVSSALVADAGTYTCVAVNAGGDTQREFDLRVYGEFIHSRVCKKCLQAAIFCTIVCVCVCFR